MAASRTFSNSGVIFRNSHSVAKILSWRRVQLYISISKRVVKCKEKANNRNNK